MRIPIGAVIVAALLSACVGTKVSIPSKSLMKSMNNPGDNAGFLDLFSMNPNPKRQSTPARFTFRLRSDVQGSPWQDLGQLNSPRFQNTRFKLPPGNYHLRIEQDEGKKKDFPIRIESSHYTMFYFGALMQTMEAPKADARGTTTQAVGNWGGSMTLPVIFDFEVGDPTPNDEKYLMGALITPDWIKRAYAAFMLGQFGTEKSIPALKSFELDAIMGEVAKDAKKKIIHPEVVSNETNHGTNSKSFSY